MTSKLTIAALSAAVLAGSFGTAALARQGGKEGMSPMARPGVYVFMLKNFDTNKDGKIVAEESKSGADALFAAVDTDKDGTLTPKEMRAWRDSKMAAMSKVTGAAAPQAGASADATGTDAQSRRHDGMKGFRHNGKGHHGMMGGGMLRMIDADENGQVSKAEAQAAADKTLKQMDVNGDGVISIDDFPG